MFKCEKCNKITAPNEKQHKIITKTRPREYINKYYKKGQEYEKITEGFEIEKEINVCEKCYEEVKEDEGQKHNN